MPTSKKAKGRKAKTRAKQEEFPLSGKGVEKISIPSLESAAERYVSLHEDAVEARNAEEAAKSDLMAEMRGHISELFDDKGLGYTYTYGNRVVVLKTSAEKVVVKTLKDKVLVDEEA